MPVDERTALGLSKLAKSLPGQARLLELAALAGNGLAAPLARVRANQARREAGRARLAFGSRSSEYSRKVAEQQAAEQLTASIDAEIERLSLNPPVPREGEVAVYGYVRDNGRPLQGVGVSLDGARGKAGIETKTGVDGSFALTGTAAEPLGLTVRKGNAVLSADDDARYTPAPRAFYRLIDVGDGDGKGRDRTSSRPIERPALAKPAEKAPYDGLTLGQALAKLAEDGRPLLRVILTPTEDEHGHIIGATMDSRNGAVTLQIATSDGHSERLDALAVLIAQDPKAEQLGLGTIEQARKRLKTAEIETLEDAHGLLDLSDATIARKAEVQRGVQARTLRTLLQDALDRLEPR